MKKKKGRKVCKQDPRKKLTTKKSRLHKERTVTKNVIKTLCHCCFFFYYFFFIFAFFFFSLLQ